MKKSEGESPCKLNDSRQIVLPGHRARVGAPGLWRIKLGAIEQVEELTPELEAISTIGPKLRVLEGGKVKVLLSVVTYVRLGTRIGAETIVRRIAGSEYRSVEP